MMLLMGLGFMVVGAATTFRRRHGLADYLVTGICGVAACLMSLLFFRSDDAKIPLGAGIFVIVLTIPQALICIIRQKRK